MEEELQNLKQKLISAKEKNSEKKILKYKQQIKQLKQQIKEQQTQQQEEEVQEEEQELSELEILKLKLQSATENNKTKKIQKYTKLIAQLEQTQQSELETEDSEKPKKKVKKSVNQIEEEKEDEEEKQTETEKQIQNENDNENENQTYNFDELNEEELNELIEKYKKKLEKAQKKANNQQNADKLSTKVSELHSKLCQFLVKQKEAKLKEYAALAPEKKAKKAKKIKKLEQEIQELKTKQRGHENTLLGDEQSYIQKFIQTDPDSFRLNPDKSQHSITIVLFYQYIEPEWTHPRFKEALRFTQQIGKELGLGGRLRVAYEGFNGTISGTYDNVRQFAEELRKWEPQSFNKTLFKFIDGLPQGTHFPNLKVFEVKELVNYGLDGFQPNIKEYGGVHLPPKEYHKKMMEDNSVIIDVRNTYESIIGRFQPPDNKKCEFIDPEWRKSTELPEWLRKQEIRDKLKGKNVLMYCTGGVRCERASAYLKKEMGEQVKNVYQLEGGIEQYMKEFPEGGFWVGKNYTFDKRFAFGAYGKDYRTDDVLSQCSGCKKPWDRYRGKKRCSACLVPLLVCKECQDQKLDKLKNLRCTLCEQQNVHPKIKRAPIQQQVQQKLEREVEPVQNPEKQTRIFVGNLPFTVNEESLRSFFRPAKLKSIQFLTDKQSQKFYGNSFVEAETPEDAGICLAFNGKELKGRSVRVQFPQNKKQQ